VNEKNRPRSLRTVAAVFLAVTVLSGFYGQAFSDSDFFDLTKPMHLGLTLFATGYGSEKYGTTHEGFEFEQSLTRYVGVVARVSAYHVYQGTGFDSPLTPAAKSSTRNFGRFEGGINLTPWQATSLVLLGGEDLGDSHAPVIDADFSSWLLLNSIHPINLSFSASHYYQNGVTSSRIDVRTVALSTADLMLLAGAGGAIWGGGSVTSVKGQGGPDLGVFLRDWRLGIDVQAGYGNSRTYGLLSFSKQFGWDE
jgi:hypothetical protein